MRPYRRHQGMAAIRIVFGVALAVDAFLKWQPAFRSDFVKYVSSMEIGQPQLVKDWLHAWASVLSTDPTLFAFLVAVCETCLAMGLILGLFSNAVYMVGIPCMLMIWSTAEGFGGPYSSGATDIGTSIIYVFMYVALYFGRASAIWSLDRHLWRRLGRARSLCTAPEPLGTAQAPTLRPALSHGRAQSTDDYQTVSPAPRPKHIQAATSSINHSVANHGRPRHN